MSLGDELLNGFLDSPSGGPKPQTGAEPLPASHRPVVTSAPSVAVKRLNYAHDQMIDIIIANPGISQNEVALRVGYSASWVSTVMQTDAFQARLAERSKEIVDPSIRASIEENFKGMLSRSMEILRHKLDRLPGDIPDNLALRTLELSSRALGFGARVLPVAIDFDMNSRLDKLGSNLTQLLRRKKAEESSTIEGEFSEQAPSS